MNAQEYNQAEMDAGRLTAAHVTALVRRFQMTESLTPDGKAGPLTRSKLDFMVAQSYDSAAVPGPDAFRLQSPLLALPDGRKAAITSEFRPADRPNHDGVDLFYHYVEGDEPSQTGDHGAAAGADGKPKWVVPTGIAACAAEDGVVTLAGNSATGYRCWVDHGNGLRTGYFHLLNLLVHVGETVKAGASLGLVGDNPVDYDARHLHFELSPVDRYAPMDPAPYLTL